MSQHARNSLARAKRETVSVSFHFLTKYLDDGDSGKSEKFTKSDFDRLILFLQAKPKPNLNDQQTADKIRFRNDVPIESVIRQDSRTAFGLFKASYWGHAYDNSAKGRIPAQSISLRPFYFLLYLGEDGRIYVGSQYLGHFGGYTGLRNTLVAGFDFDGKVHSSSFRATNVYNEETIVKEIKVTYSSKPNSIAGRNALSETGMISLRRKRGDTAFDEESRKKILPLIGLKPSKVRQELANILNKSEVISADDQDIEDCVILAQMDGRTKKIYLINEGNFASRFPLTVPIDQNGHPVAAETKKAMIKVLRDEILSNISDV